jgi:hypothetical protein
MGTDKDPNWYIYVTGQSKVILRSEFGLVQSWIIEKVFIKTIDIDIGMKFFLLNCVESVVFQVLQSSMEILNSDSDAHGWNFVKHGLLWKPSHNFTNPLLTIAIPETLLTQNSLGSQNDLWHIWIKKFLLEVAEECFYAFYSKMIMTFRKHF